jgi:L-histidine N-alpha-methyltransferase
MNFIDEQIIKVGEAGMLNFLPKRGIKNVKDEIIEGLTSKQKYISPKFFYDQTGSELFEKITQLEEYYPSRCEKEILSTIVGKLDFNFENLDIIELGSGDSSKISSIFRQIPKSVLSTISYYPVDISQSAIENSIDDIRAEFALKSVTGIVADFHHQLDLIPGKNKRLFCFLGSTIGNFSPTEVERFITILGSSMNKGDGLLLGVDMVKDTQIIEAAYNDRKGVTAKFNKNILSVVNGNIQSNFDENYFDHLAFYNPNQQRIEMHLKAKCDQQVELDNKRLTIQLKEGESIHTENSYKFTIDQLEKIGSLGGLKINKIFTDSKTWFNLVHYLS